MKSNAVINRRFGPFILLKRLAIGGMAEIFLALRLGPGSVNKLVVLKCILEHYNEDKDFIALFYQEAELSCLLDHPNMISVWEVGKIANRHCMVMEFMDGIPVDFLIEKAATTGSQIPVEVAVWIAINALDGLEYLHDLKDFNRTSLHAVHRDISPQNVFACFDGQCKLFDFGVASFGKHANQNGMLVGKYAYMSPEQCRGLSIDARSDIFSLAIVLYELCLGISLFQKDNDILTLEAVKNNDFIPPSKVKADFPPYLEIVLLKALRTKVDERYQTAREFSADLRKFLKISGFRQTSESFVEYLQSIFANRINENGRFLSQAMQQVENTFRREDPVLFLPSIYREFNEIEGSSNKDEHQFSAIDLSLDITHSRIAELASQPSSLPAPSSANLPRVAGPEPLSQAVKSSPKESDNGLKKKREGRGKYVLLLVIGIIVGIVLTLLGLQFSPS